jgi:hypothetical protein
MKLTPTVDADHIEALKRGIPDTGEMTDTTSEKPMPRFDTDPRSLLKSDSQLTWELEKLKERWQKIMKRPW